MPTGSLTGSPYRERVTMKRARTLTALAIALSLSLPLVTITEAKASECSEPREAPSSQQPTVITIIDTEIGTEAFERLVTYSNGGHSALGKAIAKAHQWFAVCEYVGVGIGHGSGGNGYRPNFMLALWRDGIDTALARSAVYQLVGASSNPVVTNGDCSVGCNEAVSEAPTTTTTTLAPTTTPTTTIAPTTTTTTVPVSETAEAVTDSEPVTVVESEPVITEAPTTTTTTTVLVVESARAITVTVLPTPNKSVTVSKRTAPKKQVTKKSPKKRTVTK
jgi:hypothetical protein